MCDSPQLEARCQAGPIAEFFAQLFRLFSEGQNCVGITEPIEGPAFQQQRAHPFRLAMIAGSARDSFRFFSVLHGRAVSSQSFVKVCETIECARLHHDVTLGLCERKELVAYLE